MRTTSQIVGAIALALLLASNAHADDLYDFDDVAEPMVFDMVRGLRAHAWEVEANTLVQIPIDKPLVVEWAPEVEFAYMDGGAIEFEAGIDNDTLTAIKLGLQNTLALTPTWAHGVQWLGEYDPSTQVIESALLYIPAWRLNDSWALLMLVGPALEHETSASSTHFGLHANVNVFWDANHWLVVGLENNLTWIDDDLLLRLMPQAQFEVSDLFEIQIGAGALHRADEWLPEVTTRVVVEF